MTRRYFKDMDSYAESDVVIIGAGSAGLSCAYELSKQRPDLKARRTDAAHVPHAHALPMQDGCTA